MLVGTPVSTIFFFNDTPTPEIYTLSLHDALPISAQLQRQDRCPRAGHRHGGARHVAKTTRPTVLAALEDRKSTRLNSSHMSISYAVFCLKKKKKKVKII